MPRRPVDLIPFCMCQRHFCGFADVGQAVGIHGSCDQLHIGRVPQDPRRRNSRFGQAVFFTDLCKFGIQFGKIRIVNESPFEKKSHALL